MFIAEKQLKLSNVSRFHHPLNELTNHDNVSDEMFQNSIIIETAARFLRSRIICIEYRKLVIVSGRGVFVKLCEKIVIKSCLAAQ